MLALRFDGFESLVGRSDEEANCKAAGAFRVSKHVLQFTRPRKTTDTRSELQATGAL